MKKLILLLILPLTASMAIDFTMTKKGLFVETTTTTQPSTSDTATEVINPYLEPVNLPKCDAGNPEVQFIRSNADWSTINSSSKRIFCVSPGNYTSLKSIELTASGTAEKRRYIILNNGNDTHPGKLPRNTTNLAMYALKFDGASYWTIDRQSFYDGSVTGAGAKGIIDATNGSQHNIFNRMFTYNVCRTLYIINGSHNNTIQNSRLDTMSHSCRTSDVTAIEIVPYQYLGEYSLKNTKIINNEIVNANDGFQSVSYWYDKNIPLNGEGTIIDSNDIYITDDIYTDGNGNYTPTGEYAYAENALDFKFGSQNSSNPMVVTNNNFWGYRYCDKTNSNLSDQGSAISIHFGVRNMVIQNNRLFDSNTGLFVGTSDSYAYALDSSTITDNIIKSCGKLPSVPFGRSVILIEVETTNFEDNLIADGRSEFSWLQFDDPGFVYQNNLCIDTPQDWKKEQNDPAATIEYHPSNNNAGRYQVVTAVSQGYTDDYSFITDKFTNNPRVITLTNVVKPK